MLIELIKIWEGLASDEVRIQPNGTEFVLSKMLDWYEYGDDIVYLDECFFDRDDAYAWDTLEGYLKRLILNKGWDYTIQGRDNIAMVRVYSNGDIRDRYSREKYSLLDAYIQALQWAVNKNI